jgi:hypothetical protein
MRVKFYKLRVNTSSSMNVLKVHYVLLVALFSIWLDTAVSSILS